MYNLTVDNDWVAIKYHEKEDKHLLAHVTTKDMVGKVIDDLNERYPDYEIEKLTGRDAAWLDPGGMASMKPKIASFELDKGKVEFAAINYGEYDYYLNSLEARNFGDGTKYYKIFCAFGYCVVMSEEHFNQLLTQMQDRKEEIEKMREEENAERQRVFDQINAGQVNFLSKDDKNLNQRLKGIPSGKNN